MSENGALSLDGAVALLRTPSEEQAQQPTEQEQTEAVEQPEAEPAEQETEAVAEAPETEQAAEEVSAEPIEPASPAVDPPAFWTKAEKELWATLTPEAQQAIARSEKAREQHTAKIQQEIAAERKAFAEAQAAIEQERQQYQQLLYAQLPPPPDPSLIDTNPVEYLRQREMFERGVAQFQQMEQQRQAEEAKRQELIAAEEAKHYEAERQKLNELIPEFADPEQAPKVAQALTVYAKEQGYDDATLRAANANDLLVLHKAMKWDQAQKAAAAAKAKPLPKVAAPGVARSQAQRAADNRNLALARLERTGSIEDAVSALRA